MLPYHCQTRPVGRVGDQPKAANEAAAFRTSFPAASPDVLELTSASPPAAVTLEDGRYVWGAVDVEAEAPVASVDDFETLFPVSAAALLAASSDVIELTSASPPAPVTLDDGRWSWGAVARHRLDRVPV